MKIFFKNLYLHFRLGPEYKQKIQTATRYGWMLEDMTIGDLSHFHNIHGERIRGWHKKSPSFKFEEHSLVTYYKNR